MQLEKELNPQQLKAVMIQNGPILILAGAGSGKTRVITYRIAYLIKEKNLKPYNILAVTFTNKAANEMQNRVSSLLNEDRHNVWIKTFHSTCVKILRRDGPRIGIKNNFIIYDDSDQISIIKECLSELNIDPKQYKPSYVANIINREKEQLKNPENFTGDELVGSVYRAYEKKLSLLGGLDFDDLIFKTVVLFQENADVLEKYQETWKYIMIDEYQDTNKAQYVLTNLLAKKYRNLCVVGDDDQSIYSWRGAEISNILDFEKDYPETVVIKLEQNYRSTKIILKCATEVIKNNSLRKSKTLWCDNQEGDKIELFNAFDNRTEADFISLQVLNMFKSGINYNDIAVFFRINSQSRSFEEAFIKYRIPYEVIGALKFYDRAEIKNVISYLRVINNSSDNINLLRIINTPTRNIGKTTQGKLSDIANGKSVPIYEILKDIDKVDEISQNIKLAITNFVTMIEDLKKEKTNLIAVTAKLLTNTGYYESLKFSKAEDERERAKNIEELLASMKDFCENNEEATLNDYIENISLQNDIDELNESTQKVFLMTLHNAKGLEFNHVFITGLEDGLLPHHSALNDLCELEEERRLFYVGLTRAKKKLVLTFAQVRSTFGETLPANPSQFLKEIPSELLLNSPGYEARIINAEFEVGNWVYHPVYKKGKITEISGSNEDTKVSILFTNNETKLFLLRYANLKKI